MHYRLFIVDWAVFTASDIIFFSSYRDSRTALVDTAFLEASETMGIVKSSLLDFCKSSHFDKQSLMRSTEMMS